MLNGLCALAEDRFRAMGGEWIFAAEKTEQETYQQCRSNMDDIEPQSNGGRAKYTDTHHAQQKTRPGVVAEGEQPLSLAAVQLTLAVQRRRCAYAYGIPAGKTTGQHGPAVPAKTEQGAHQWREKTIQRRSGQEGRQQSGENQERK